MKVFARYEDEATVGMPTGTPLRSGGYLYVLDVDTRNGGTEALAALPDLPLTVTARTKGGWHYWFRTEIPMPTVYREDGLELKGAGAFVVVPPAPGRTWLRDPFEFEIADCPDWLLPDVGRGMAKHEPLSVRHDPDTGCVGLDLGNPLAALRAARPGTRRRALLVQGGRVAAGGGSTQARQELHRVAVEVGIADSEASRLLDYCFSTAGGREGKRSNSSCHIKLSERDLAVLRLVAPRFSRPGVPFRAMSADIFSTRYVAEQVELGHPQKAKRCLDKLVEAGLLWRSPYPKRFAEGVRACNRFRPTYAGLATAGVTAT